MKITDAIIIATAKKLHNYKNDSTRNSLNSDAFDTIEQYEKQVNLLTEEIKQAPEGDLNLITDKVSSAMLYCYLMNEKQKQIEKDYYEAQDKYYDNLDSKDPKLKEKYDNLQKKYEDTTQFVNDFFNKTEQELGLPESDIQYCVDNTEKRFEFDETQREKEAEIAKQEQAKYKQENTISFDKSYLANFVDYSKNYQYNNSNEKSFVNFVKEDMDIRQSQIDDAEGASKEYLKQQDKEACLGAYPKLQHDYDKKNWFAKIFAFKERKQLKTIKSKLESYGVKSDDLKNYKDFVESKFDLDNKDLGNEVFVPDVFEKSQEQKEVNNEALEQESLTASLKDATNMMQKAETGKNFDEPNREEVQPEMTNE